MIILWYIIDDDIDDDDHTANTFTVQIVRLYSEFIRINTPIYLLT